MRTNNWPAKLALFVEEKRNQPFNWVFNNCGFFACDWVAMLTGSDPAAMLRILTAKQLSKAMRERTLPQLATELGAAGNWPQCGPLHSRRGDVVEIELPGIGPTLGVCLGVQSVFPGEAGVVFNPTANCSRAWRID